MPRSFRMGPSTNVTIGAGNRSFSISRKTANGAQLFVESRRLANGQRQVTAYRITRNAAAGTESRLYTDGRRIVVGRNFVSRSQPGHLTTTTTANGLREARLPNGKLAYRDTFRDANGERVVTRTVYSRVHDGRAWLLSRPVTQTFRVVPFRGADLYVYQPWESPPGFIDLFAADFAVALAPAIVCPECLTSNEVEFSGMPRTYTDPDEMLGDNIVAGGIHDGMNAGQDNISPADGEDASNMPPVALGNVEPDPELASLNNDSNELKNQAEAAAAQAGDPAIQDDFSAGGLSSAPAHPTVPVNVSSSVREQVRKQVKQDLVLEKGQQPLVLTNVVSSGKAGNYIFQVNDFISTTDTASGDGCVLSTGDLIKFDQVPDDNANVAQMKVVTAKEGSCPAGAVVQVSFGDLQNMLNGFSQRLETAMHNTHDKVVAAEPASPDTKG